MYEGFKKFTRTRSLCARSKPDDISRHNTVHLRLPDKNPAKTYGSDVRFLRSVIRQRVPHVGGNVTLYRDALVVKFLFPE